MAFAPLDTWLRVVVRAKRAVGPRYWLRLLAVLATAAVATVVTLPERLIAWPLVRRLALRGKPPAKVLVVLGYYRSGTTHLHYLLSADPRTTSPTWTQCLMPQGFVASWGLLRWVLVPFLTETRPQDGVAFGSQWPAEDDFYLANRAGASTLFGRFVFPKARARFEAWNRVSAASERDRRAFRAALRELIDKLRVVKPGRVIVLKTPAHTARIPALIDALGDANVRFVHLSRTPAAVVDSNLAMHERLRPYEFESPPSESERRDQIVEEFIAAERSFLADARALSDGTVCRLRYEDLLADPEGALSAIRHELRLDEWGLKEDPDATEAHRAYLATVRSYTPKHRSPTAGSPDGAFLDPRLIDLARELGHDDPPAPHRPPRAPVAIPHQRAAAGIWAPLGVAVVLVPVWIGLAWLTGNRLDWLIWPAGLMLGSVGLRASRIGSPRLGAWCGLLTVLVLAAIAFPATYLAYNDGWSGYDPWLDVRKSVVGGMLRSQGTWVYLLLGIASAYQYASRAHPSPPGASAGR